ncbi:MAG: hypothetical protein LBH96_04470 [Candidatus Peribacteria bacterium]|jgi:hypothetical protein|nr:hypothetical protein [Candidatus Peribacteria bacterium]
MDQWRADLTKYGKRSRKGYKAKRQLELYEKSTQSTHLFGDTKQFADAILKGATATNLTPNQQNAFHFDVLKAYARLDFYRKQGHNFLKSEDARQIEQDFHALEKALQLVAERNGGTSMTEIPALIGATDPSSGRVINYNDLRADFEKDYTKAKTKF